MSKALHVVVLAAGEGTRMQSRLPKVLQSLGGRPMLTHLLDTVCALEPEAVHVVVGSGAEQVQEACVDYDVNWVLQAERRGTGHAVIQVIPAVPDEAQVLVLLGDHPLIPLQVLEEMAQGRGAPLSVLTMELERPRGYGRIVRDRLGRISGVVEDHDATPAQWRIREVNTGIILADALELRGWLDRLDCANAKGEYYLTDIFAMAHHENKEIHGVLAPDPRDLQGANDRRQLAALEARLRELSAISLMERGVHLIDPLRLDVRGRVETGADVHIDVNVVLEGDNRLGDGVSLGPGCVVKNCDLAAGTRVHAHSVLDGARTHGPCDIGPFARLRPGTVLAAGCRIGNFVETKNASLGEGSKAGHLSYLGDVQIGQRVNIGAGTITCNYDGANKHRTIIGDDVFIGSNTELVAPLRVEDGALVGAGSTITKDVPAGSLAVGRARQAIIEGWQRPRKKKDG
ncbi:MAG: bifunctional UDP-N-acetylglucosamine diphosphorylase/glucosamine-1-phosphate N-acetyltransferase GlmU [Xanthomonadales bacterium]|nr:bifunctional UDP-N-acetylglucosamine diphosphorylase/glucosamine-1-phosphate N-acetyltransferase GlmU [Xanthomonadales bacterium]